MMVFHGGGEHDDDYWWPKVLEQREREIAGEEVRIVLDEMVVPGKDPHDLPAVEPLPVLILALAGLVVAIVGIAAVLYGVA